jgi:hypothetical protein
VLHLHARVHLDEVVPPCHTCTPSTRAQSALPESPCLWCLSGMGGRVPCLSTRNSTVPAHRYLAAAHSLVASSKSACRVAGGRPSAGAVSTTCIARTTCKKTRLSCTEVC